MQAPGWPQTWQNITYGSSNYLWGLSLSAAEVNDAAFGFQFEGAGAQLNQNTTFEIDFIGMGIYYSGYFDLKKK